MGVKINSLELENVKRIKAVKMEPTANGLTVVGGKNNQGKTSVLDAIAWVLGGNSFQPSQPERNGSVLPPNLKVILSNGIVVERNGKNSTLKVTDPSGKKGGQALLDSFIEKLALNLPKFLEMNSKEKARTMLNIIGLEQQITQLELKEKELYNNRLTIGRIAEQKDKFAKEMTFYPDAPEDLVSASELIMQQQAILARNGENQRKRDRLKEITFEKERVFDEAQRIEEQIKELQARLVERKQAYEIAKNDEQAALKTVAQLVDESTAELEENIRNIEQINVMVRANLDKEKAENEAKEYGDQYDSLTSEIENVRKEKLNLLNDAQLPLPGLSVQDGELTYNGQQWDNMSGSEQLKVATSIVRKLNPECGFVLVDKLEQMDLDTMNEFGQWLESEGLQVIATRVSTGEECSVIIEDGYIKDNQAAPQREWKAGEF